MTARHLSTDGDSETASSETEETQSDWDPLAPDAAADPFGAHQRLREEVPVAYSDRWGGFWALTRYDDIANATRDTETFSSSKASIPISTAPNDPPRAPLEIDPPRHDGYRRMLNPYFAPRFIRSFETQIRSIAVELIEPVISGEIVDVVPVLTFPMPVQVLCAFLGIPREDGTQIKTWANDVIEASRAGDTEAHKSANGSIYSYIERIVADRRLRPLDPSEDLISGLIFGTVHLIPLSDPDIAGILRVLLAAGHGTTTNAMGSILRFLAENPAHQERLRANVSLIPTAIEEILRVWSPSRALGRKATRDVVMNGRTIKKGEKVALVWSSANRDESVFRDADHVDVTRRPNRHLAFGHGIHTCLGAPLARAELRILTEEFLARTSRITAGGPVQMANWPHIGPSALPLKAQPAV